MKHTFNRTPPRSINQPVVHNIQSITEQILYNSIVAHPTLQLRFLPDSMIPMRNNKLFLSFLTD